MEYLKLDDFMTYNFLSQLKYSPDGMKSALVVKTASDDNSYYRAIYINKSDGYQALTNTKGNVAFYKWLDDETILFSELRDERIKAKINAGYEMTCFYKININGGEAEEAFIIDALITDITPLAEGNYLVAAMFDRSRPDLIGKTFAQQEEILKEYKKEEDYQVIDELPYWSNGVGFTNKKCVRLYTFSKDAGLTPVTSPLIQVDSYEVSPCGGFVVFSGNTNPTSVRELKNRLYLLTLDTGEIEALEEEPIFIKAFKFWGNKLVYIACEGETYNMHQHSPIGILDIRTKEYTKLSEYDSTIGSAPGSDCKLGGGYVSKVYKDDFYFVSMQGFYSDIYKIALTTGEIENITNTGGSLDFFDISEQGITAVAMLEGQLEEVYSLENGTLNRISSFNEVIHTSKKYAKPQHHVLKDAEGYDFDGWVLLPVDYAAGKKYPAILNIHGGPKTAYGDIYFHEMQYWANQNYFVLFSNPRGSDGKGNDFAEIRGKYGMIDYENIMQFVDEMLVAYPDIDAARLGVTGGSYGGFMTNWIIGHTDRFAAAASQRSISNWIGFNYISDIGYYFGPDQLQADIYTDIEKVWWHSPLKYANQVTTPTLFIHSDEDYRCWIPEAYQMYTALKVHGVESRICMFHGENHELSRSGKPEHRARRLKEITDWMDKYLKTDL